MGLLHREADAVKRAVAKEHGVSPDEVRLTGGLSFRGGYRQNSIWIPGKGAVGSASTGAGGVRWATDDGKRRRSGRA